jgi:hypothetical protein
MSVPSHASWMKYTALGAFKARSSELKAIDVLLIDYEKAKSTYGKEWTANELRIALEKWKKALGANWKGDERNKSKIVEDLDVNLPAAKTNRIGTGSAMEGETARQLRHATLFFLANASTTAVPKDVAGFLNDGTDTSGDVQKFEKTGESGGWQFRNGSFYDKSNKQNSFLDDVIARLNEYVKDLAEHARAAGAFLNIDGIIGEAVAFIAAGLPDLLIQVLGALVSKISTVIAVVKGLAQAGKAAVAAWNTRNWETAILKGAPSEIMGSVREQIKNSGYDGVKAAIKAGVLAGLSAIPGVGDVVGAIANAIASVYAFVTKIFDHFRELRLLKVVFADARTQLSAKLYESAAPFNTWFKKTIATLPIVSSYCMTLPLTGSYYGFLTLVAADGTELSYKQLERNYGMFNDVKSWARKFIGDHGVRLHSDNSVVEHSIKAARGEKTTWDNLKGGVVDRVGRTAMGMIEASLS